jgi:hypothetical protein
MENNIKVDITETKATIMGFVFRLSVKGRMKGYCEYENKKKTLNNISNFFGQLE